jgi:hypothetical protein
MTFYFGGYFFRILSSHRPRSRSRSRSRSLSRFSYHIIVYVYNIDNNEIYALGRSRESSSA